MNCKPGDLAIYVGKHKSAQGKIVKCVRLLNVDECLFEQQNGFSLPAWRIEPKLMMDDGLMAKNASDKALRPIRDQDGEDEMLRIAGYPHKETA